MSTYEERSLERLSKGICSNCSRPAEPNRKHCSVCMEAHRKCADRRSKALKDAGLCMRCGKAPHADGIVLCGACKAVVSEYNKKRYQGRK